MSTRAVAAIVAISLALGGVAGAAAWAVTLAATGPSSGPPAGDGTIDDRDDGEPFFRADELVQFFVDESEIEQISGQRLPLRSAGTWHRAGGFDVQPRECAAVFGLVDASPAGAREQSDLSRDDDQRSRGIFFQSVYQFAPADDASSRFEAMAESFASCVRIETSGGGTVAEISDPVLEDGEVSSAAASVTIIYGMETESFVIAATHAANVISVSILWDRLGVGPLPPDARRLLVTTMTEKSSAAVERWHSGVAPSEDSSETDDALAEEDNSSTRPPNPAAPVEGTFTAVDPARFENSMMEGVRFLSPSGNLGCIISPPGVYDELWGCTIGVQDWQFPSDSPDDFCFEAPISCGRGIEAFGNNTPEPRLRGDVGYPAAMAISTLDGGSADVGMPVQTLEYGSSVTLGPVTCYSELAAITCHHAGTQHGFSIAKDRNLIY